MDKPIVALLPANGTNMGHARQPSDITHVILHVMEGYANGTTREFQEFHPPGEEKSCHYGITVEGAIIQWVPDLRVAFHAGNSDYNRKSIGIELEGFIAHPERLTERQYGALLSLCRWLCETYDIDRNLVHIIGHAAVPDPRHPGQFGGAAHHVDPGPHFPWWERLRDDLNKEGVQLC